VDTRRNVGGPVKWDRASRADADRARAMAAASQQTSGSAAEITELAGEFSAAIDRFAVSGTSGPPPRPAPDPASVDIS